MLITYYPDKLTANNVLPDISRKTVYLYTSSDLKLYIIRVGSISQKFLFLQNTAAGRSIGNHNWLSTTLGHIDNWPHSLRATLQVVLASPLPMFIVWGSEQLVFCNDAFTAMAKHPKNNAGLTGSKIFGLHWELFEPVIAQAMQEASEATLTTELLSHEDTPVGQKKLTIGFAPLFGDDDTIAGVVATCSANIPQHTLILATHETEQPSKGEIRFRSLIKNAPVATALLRGPEFTIDIANDVMLTYWGKESDIVGKRLQDVLPELAGQGFFENFEKVFYSGIEYKEVAQKAIYIQNGILVNRYYDYTISPVFDASGTVTSVLNMASDVTAQVQSVQAQIESEAHLQLLRDTVPAMIFYLDQDQRYVSVNKVFLEWFNATPAEVIGRTVNEFLGDVTYAKTKPHLDIVYRGEQEKYELYAPTRMGIPRWLSIVYTPHLDGQGTVKGVIVHAIDITQHKQTEIALRKSEARLLSVFDAAPVGICLFTGPDFIIETPNQPFIALAGKGSDISGKTLLEVLPELDGQPQMKALRDVYTTGKSFVASGEPGIILHDGERRQGYYNISLTPLLDNDNNIYAILNVIADVTEEILSRKKIEEAERALRGVIDLAQLGTWTMDIATGTTVLSQRHAEMFGLSSTLHTLESAASVIVPDDAKRVTEAFTSAMEKGSDGRYEAEYRIINATTGKLHIIQARGQASFDDAGNPISITGTARDVTIQKELQTALENEVQLRTNELALVLDELRASNTTLEATNSELKRSNEELSQYAYVASHDLQEPLRKIRFFTGLLQDGAGRLSPGELVSKINRSAERMSTLISDLLSFSRLLETKAVFQHVNLNKIITAVWDDFELVAEEKSAVLKAETLPVINALGLQMNQLFYNLFSNALKFTDPGVNPIITISYALVTPDALSGRFAVDLPLLNYHHIRFIDNGIGFEARHADQIFDIFKRLHGTTEYPGSGIGLALCRRIVINHHGYLYAESEPGKGAVFHILLPFGG